MIFKCWCFDEFFFVFFFVVVLFFFVIGIICFVVLIVIFIVFGNIDFIFFMGFCVFVIIWFFIFFIFFIIFLVWDIIFFFIGEKVNFVGCVVLLLFILGNLDFIKFVGWIIGVKVCFGDCVICNEGIIVLGFFVFKLLKVGFLCLFWFILNFMD